MTPRRTWRRALKRLFDILAGGLLLLLGAPVIAACMIAVRRRSPGPALFRQTREGRLGVPFVMLKLRTMHQDGDALLERWFGENPEARDEWRRYRRLADDPRIITGLGGWLRRTSLDELPQLWNVVRGEMSLVGPRPLELAVTGDLPAEPLALRRSVRPGMTGLWQVSGRSEGDLETLVMIDARYVSRWSLWTDLAILSRTPGAVLSRRGAY